jgi:aldose sugar dehydrogenase
LNRERRRVVRGIQLAPCLPAELGDAARHRPSPSPAMATRRLLRLTALALLPLIAACGSGTDTPDTPDPDPVDPGTGAVPTLSRTTVVGALSSPWDIAFMSDGTMLYTEKCRGLSIRFADATTVRLFGTTGSSLVASDLNCEGQSGVHGVALDPDFATNRRVYVFMGSSLTTPRTNRVVRMVLGADFRSASQRFDIVTDIAFKHVGTANGGAGAHSGGRIRFGPDRFLYVTTGDNHNAMVPQSQTLMGGKVLRITTDGGAAPGNAAPAGFDRRIYTYGHRNVQGLSFRPGTGQPFTGEHGPGHNDEVTALVNGGNAGWDPQNRQGLNCPDNYCGYQGGAAAMPMTDTVRFPNAMRASWANNGSSQGMGPVEFLRGTQWGAWNGRLAVGIMGGTRLEILELDAAGRATGTTNSGVQATRFRGLTQGPDGNLYIATDAGEIWRVTPTTR